MFGNRSFRAIFFGLILGSVISGVESAFTPFMGFHFWDFTTTDLSWLALVGFVAFPVSFVLIPALTRLLDKRMAVVLPLACWTTAVNVPICLRLLDVPWFPGNESPWVLIIFVSASTVGALAAPIIGATANSMLALGFYLRYEINRERHAEIASALRQRREEAQLRQVGQVPLDWARSSEQPASAAKVASDRPHLYDAILCQQPRQHPDPRLAGTSSSSASASTRPTMQRRWRRFCGGPRKRAAPACCLATCTASATASG